MHSDAEPKRAPNSGSTLAQAAAAAAAERRPSARAVQGAGGDDVARLLALLQAPESPLEVLLPVLKQLARWARQQGLQPPAARDAAALSQAVAAGRCLMAASPLHHAAEQQQQLAAACMLLLGSTAAAAPSPAVLDDIAEAVGSALLGPQLGAPQPDTAAQAMAAVGSLLPCLLDAPVAACWLLASLLQWLGGWEPAGQPACLALECLAPAYGMMRGVGVAALGRAPPPAAVVALLRPAYSVLKGAAAAAGGAPAGAVADGCVQAAAAVLALGGLAEALLRSAAGFADAAQLAAEVEGSLVAACEVAAAAALAAEAAADRPLTAPGTRAAALPAVPHEWLALLRDACSLAGAQLGAAVQRPALVSSSALATCQAESLLGSALSLDPFRQAADAGVPPQQASRLLQSQAACSLAQHAAAMASGLAASYPRLDASWQGWLVRQVQVAAGQVCQHWRHLSLATSADWLAGLDVAASQQLLDRLFLSCLVLLCAAWEAGGGAQAAPAGRAHLAADVAAALADLQFCRLNAPQYAALLQGILPEVPGSGAAAARLVCSLPCYAEAAAPCPVRGGQPAWLADGALAAKAQFLFNALVPCCSALPQAALEERLAPLAFLYLLHPHRPAAAAAHQLLCALMVAVPEAQRRPLAAYYVRRSLEGCPGATPLQQFGQGLATILQALPVGSPVGVLCLERVLDKAGELAARRDAEAPELAALAAQQLLLVDHCLLDGAMAACDRLLRPQPGGGGGAGGATAGAAAALLRGQVLAAVRHSDDCVRKTVLARWLLEGRRQEKALQ